MWAKLIVKKSDKLQVVLLKKIRVDNKKQIQNSKLKVREYHNSLEDRKLKWHEESKLMI